MEIGSEAVNSFDIDMQALANNIQIIPNEEVQDLHTLVVENAEELDSDTDEFMVEERII